MQSVKEQFGSRYEKFYLYPSLDPTFIVFSSDIWNKFIRIIDNKTSPIADLGCGGGTLLYNLEREGFKNLIGIDFCKSIPDDLLRGSRFILGDVLNVPCKNEAFEAVIATMVIEHVAEELFIDELYRILKVGGVALVTSVFKRPGAWYFYKNQKGEYILDPTHLREYKDRAVFTELFTDKFEVLNVQITQYRPSLIEPIFRGLFVATRKKIFRDMPTKNWLIRKLRCLKVPVPGYASIEAIIKKK